MATRSTIWIKKENGKYDGIYCHWNGNPFNNGRILVEDYQDIEKVKGLIELGSISSLHSEITCPEGHSFDSPVEGYVVAYHRDRGEELCIYRDISSSQLKKYFEEYNYFFIKNEWVLKIGNVSVPVMDYIN